MPRKSKSNLPPGILWKRGKYYGRWMHADGRERQRALSPTLSEAVLILNRIRFERDRERHGLGELSAQATTLGSLVAPYIDDLAMRAVARHVDHRRQHLRDAVSRLGEKRAVGSLKVEHLMTIRAHFVSSGSSNRTANAKAASVVAMLRWAEVVGLISANPIRRLPMLPETGRHLRRVRHRLTTNESRVLLARCLSIDQAEGGVPQAALIKTLLGAGLRFGEAAALRWSDIISTPTGPAIRVRAETAKTSRERIVPISTDLAMFLGTYRLTAGSNLGKLLCPGDWVFWSRRGKPLDRRTNGSAALAFLRRCLVKPADWNGEWPLQRRYPDGSVIDLHALRHTYATVLGETGADISTIAYLMGHTTIQMSARYADLSRGDARSAIERVAVMLLGESAQPPRHRSQP